MLEAPPQWGWQAAAAPARAQLEGSRTPSQGSDGGEGCAEASKTQSPMGPDQKQSTDGDQRSLPPQVSLSGRQDGTLGVRRKGNAWKLPSNCSQPATE